MKLRKVCMFRKAHSGVKTTPNGERPWAFVEVEDLDTHDIFTFFTFPDNVKPLMQACNSYSYGDSVDLELDLKTIVYGDKKYDQLRVTFIRDKNWEGD